MFFSLAVNVLMLERKYDTISIMIADIGGVYHRARSSQD
jgi:hypothetical protein